MDMMQQRQLYPIGIQTFSEIRGKGYLYIDKTEYVYRMTHSDSKYVFLAALVVSARVCSPVRCTLILKVVRICLKVLPLRS